MTNEQTDDTAGLPSTDLEARDDWRARVDERLEEGARTMEALHTKIDETKVAVEEAHQCLDSARDELAQLRSDLAGVIEWSQRVRLTKRITGASARFLGQCVKDGALSLSGVAKVVAPIVSLALLAYGAYIAFRTGTLPPGLLGH